MANPGITLLIVLIIVLTVGIILGLIVTAITFAENQTNSGGTGTVLPPCSQSTNISSLIQIPNSGSNCVQNGQTGSLFYIGNLGNKELDYVVAPWKTQPLDVCIGYCSQFKSNEFKSGGVSGGTCTGPNFNGKTAQANFNNCMTQLTTSVSGCVPPIPLAAKGTIVYYAFSPTCRICDTCTET